MLKYLIWNANRRHFNNRPKKRIKIEHKMIQKSVSAQLACMKCEKKALYWSQIGDKLKQRNKFEK